MKKSLKDRILEKRTAKGLSQFKTAYEMNISSSRLQSIEQGYDEKRLSKKILDRIETWLGKD